MYAFCPDFLQRIFFSYALLCSPSDLIQAEFGGQQGMKSVQAARRRRWKDPGLGTGKDIHIYIYIYMYVGKQVDMDIYLCKYMLS